MEQPRCDLCTFWKKSEQTNDRRHPDDLEGECRRNAPSPRPFDFHYEVLKHLTTLSWNVSDEEDRKKHFDDWEEADCTGTTTWPLTFAHDWCGEFRRNPETDAFADRCVALTPPRPPIRHRPCDRDRQREGERQKAGRHLPP